MAKTLGGKIPSDLLSRLSDIDHSHVGNRVILLTTVDKEGWARHAMLSYYEVVAKSDHSLLILTYAKSSAAENLLRTGNVTILFVDEEVSYYVRGKCAKIGDGRIVGSPGEILFSCMVTDVSEDKLPTAKILSGLTFSGYDPGMPKENRIAVRTKMLKMLYG
ncbi:MAG: pyridoxamine 5'-phosphate oxidase family protein [Nitrososphaerales archaeon]